MRSGLLFRFFVLTSLIIPSVVLVGKAQSKAPTTTGLTLRDGAFRRGSVMMRLQAGQASRLTAPFTLTNGTVVHPDGAVVAKDGTRQQLGVGRSINLQGEIVSFRDDMMSATAIEQYDQRVTGATPTRIEVSGAGPVPANAVAELLRAERRFAVLQQLAELLYQRTSTETKSSSFAQLDAQIKALNSQL